MNARSILAAAGLLLLPTACAADAFSEFRIPDHSWRSGSTRFDAWAARQHSSDLLWVSTSRNASGQLDARLELGRDSDRLSRSFVMHVAGGLGGMRGESSYGAGTTLNDDRTGDSNRRIELRGAQRSYLGLSAWAVGGSASFRASFSQAWRRSDRQANDVIRTLSRGFFSDDRYFYDGAAVVTFGRGRVRDATVVMDAHVLEGRLLEAGTISRALSPETRARLAEVLLAGREIGAAHERPDRFYWREVERVLREGGALGPAGLDAYAVMRAREPYASLARMRGAYAGVLLEGRHLHDVERSRNEYAQQYLQGDSLLFSYRDARSDRVSTGYDDVFAGVEGEIHRPVGWRWQFDASGSVSAPVSTDDHGLDTATRLSADWIVADRWRAGAFFASERSYLRHGDDPVRYVRDGWRTQLGASVSYFVEDHLTLVAQYASLQDRWNYGSGVHPYWLDHRVSLGLTYRFLGRFEAPGLIESMRRL